MRCEVYRVINDGEKSYIGDFDFLLVPAPGDQVQLADELFVVSGRRIHDVDGEQRGAVEIFVKDE